MHDWLLIEIRAVWEDGSLELIIKNPNSQLVSIHVRNFYNFEVSRKMEWGRSESINSHELISRNDSTGYTLSIEMQSGDSIRIEAEEFIFPHDITT